MKLPTERNEMAMKSPHRKKWNGYEIPPQKEMKWIWNHPQKEMKSPHRKKWNGYETTHRKKWNSYEIHPQKEMKWIWNPPQKEMKWIWNHPQKEWGIYETPQGRNEIVQYWDCIYLISFAYTSHFINFLGSMYIALQAIDCIVWYIVVGTSADHHLASQELRTGPLPPIAQVTRRSQWTWESALSRVHSWPSSRYIMCMSSFLS